MSRGLAPAAGRQGPGPMPGATVAALDLAFVRRTAGALPGDHRALGVGAGTELAQLRPYRVGDDVRQIDPAASARTGELHVRQHVPERALATWVILDLSPSMAFGTTGRLKSDVAEGVVRTVSRLAIRRGGRIGVLTCGSADQRLLPPRGGRPALGAVGHLLDEGVCRDGHADPGALRAAIERMRRMAVQPGLITVVSDFREENLERPLHALAARHRVLGVEIGDPREEALPDAGMLAFVDPETGRQVEADCSCAAVRDAFAVAEAERRTRVADALRRAGARHVSLRTDRDWLRELAVGLR